MGIVRMGPPEAVVLALRDRHGIQNFVETGTFRGDTAEWAARHFARVHTIERAKEYFERARDRLAPHPNIQCWHGNSASRLEEILTHLDGPAIFWLDAHHCSQGTAGAGEPCPLLEELRTLARFPADKFLLVDDARLFLSPPPSPHPLDEYPPIWETLDAMRAGSDAYDLVFEDVIISVPAYARDTLAAVCQEQNTLSDRTFWRERAKGHWRKAAEHVSRGIRAWL